MHDTTGVAFGGLNNSDWRGDLTHYRRKTKSIVQDVGWRTYIILLFDRLHLWLCAYKSVLLVRCRGLQLRSLIIFSYTSTLPCVWKQMDYERTHLTDCKFKISIIKTVLFTVIMYCTVEVSDMKTLPAYPCDDHPALQTLSLSRWSCIYLPQNMFLTK